MIEQKSLYLFFNSQTSHSFFQNLLNIHHGCVWIYKLKSINFEEHYYCKWFDINLTTHNYLSFGDFIQIKIFVML